MTLDEALENLESQCRMLGLEFSVFRPNNIVRPNRIVVGWVKIKTHSGMPYYIDAPDYRDNRITVEEFHKRASNQILEAFSQAQKDGAR